MSNFVDYEALCSSFTWQGTRRAFPDFPGVSRGEAIFSLSGRIPGFHAAALGTLKRNDIGLDLMNFLNCVITISKQLCVAIPEADYGKVATFGKCSAYITIREPQAS